MNRVQRAIARMLGIEKNIIDYVTWGSGGDPSTWQFAQDWLKAAIPTTDRVTQPYVQHQTVAQAIETIALDAAGVPWEVFAPGSEDPLDDHPLLDLFSNPHPLCSGLELFVGTYISYLLFGEAFWYYPDLSLSTSGPRQLRGTDGQIDLLDPRSVVHKFEGGELRWMLRVRGEERPLDSEWLTQFKRWNPYFPVRGLSKLQALDADIQGDHGAAKWNERFFGEQNGIPSGVLTPSTGSMLTKDQREELRKTWNQRHGATKRSVAIIPAGWSFTAMGVTHEQMEFRGLREYSREQILGFFGVPPFIAGVLEKANYANAREQKEVYWNGTITRFLAYFREQINQSFIPDLGLDVEVHPKWEAVKSMTFDLNMQVDTGQKLFAMGVPFEQINERLELGFDPEAVPMSDVGYLPMNLTPVELLSEPPTSAELASDRGETPQGETVQQFYRRPRSLSDGGREQRRALVWRQISIRTLDLEREFRRVIRNYIRDLRAESLSSFDGARGWLRRQNHEVQLFDLDEANLTLVRRTRPLHRRSFKRGGESILAEIGLAIAFDLEDPLALAKLAEMSENIKGFNERLEFRLRGTLIEGVQESESVDQLRDRIAHEFNTTLGRSRTIARTETGFAFNSGRNISMRKAGIDRREWLTSRDADVRDAHVPLDGEQRNMGEAFSNGLLFPQDPSGPAGEIINCRCVEVPVVEV